MSHVEFFSNTLIFNINMNAVYAFLLHDFSL